MEYSNLGNIFNSDLRIFLVDGKIKTLCSCRKKNCIHSYYVINKLLKKYHKDKKVVKVVEQKVVIGYNPSKWRFIPFNKFNTKTLSSFKKGSTYIYLYDLEIQVIDESVLKIVPRYSNEYYKGLDIKFVGNNIGFKCSKCRHKNNYLCGHQAAIFDSFMIDSIRFLYNSRNLYRDFIQNQSDNLGIELASFKKLFDVIFEDGRFYAVKANDNFFIDINEFENVIYQTTALDVFDPKKYFKDLSISDKTLYAGLWTNEENGNCFISGVPKKNSIELNTHIKHVVNVEESKIEKYNLLFLYEVFQNNLISLADKLSLLKNNYLNLSNITHYLYPFYYQQKITKSKLQKFTFSPHFVKQRVEEINDTKGLYKFKYYFTINDLKIDINEYKILPFFLIKNGEAFLYHSVYTKRLLENKNIFENEIQFLAHSYTPKLAEKIGVFVENFDHSDSTIERQLHLSKYSDYILFEPTMRIDGAVYNIVKYQHYPEPTRSLLEEEYFRFECLHDSFSNLQIDNYFYLNKHKVFVENWFYTFILYLQENEYKIFGQDIVSKLKINPNRASISIHINSQIDWLEPLVEVKFGELTVQQKEWLKAVERNDQYVELSDGSMGLLPKDWFVKLKDVYNNSVVEHNVLKISKLKFNSIQRLFPLISEDSLLSDLKDKVNKFNNFSKNQIYNLPKSIVCRLRPYQIKGYQWLMFLDDFGFGGILADDMGLGKTIQIIVFLQKQKEFGKKGNLIVVPRSLVGNWQSELSKFGPDLESFIYIGSKRKVDSNRLSEFDVVITTYDIVTRDIDELLKIVFNYVILDESQNIKNPNSKRYKALKLIRAANKLALTGTPIENNTFDLYSQFSFVNPGFFGSMTHFKKKFSDRIDVHGEKDAAEQLMKMIYPFLLRRTKSQVARDLPEKNEYVLYCEFSDIHRQMYETIRKGILNELKGGGKELKFLALQGMLKLRKFCNSPLLIDKTLTGEAAISVKLKMLISKIKENNTHKSLVFSQFVQTLDIIKKAFDKEGIKYAYLDGSTRERMKVVHNFEKDDFIQVFLISLKAGNSGLNLISADYVYIFDPWWNPAVEAQAIDRTHRIGQTKPIFAYKLIVKDSIEEKILHLQSKKKELADELIKADDNSFKSLSKSELLDLFK